jgi:hypothetical protein
VIKRDTVLVLGAGASMEYGYPSGIGLKKTIIHLCENTPESLKYIHKLREFGEAFKNSGQPSIDAFLQHRQEFLDAGKACIAASLLNCEENNKINRLFFHTDENWYQHLFEKMIDKGLDGFEKNKLTVITFNYDMSFENFFYWALRNSFGVDSDVVKAVMAKIKIYHIHGCLSHIPWDLPECSKYGDPQNDFAGVTYAASKLKIIYEGGGIEGTDSLAKAQQALQEAEVILLLGFGYHKLNVDRLNIPFNKGKTIFGTTHGMTAFEVKRLAASLGVSDATVIDPSKHELVDPRHTIMGLFRNIYDLSS